MLASSLTLDYKANPFFCLFDSNIHHGCVNRAIIGTVIKYLKKNSQTEVIIVR